MGALEVGFMVEDFVTFATLAISDGVTLNIECVMQEQLAPEIHSKHKI